jgi:putative DNA primase/helicase
VRRFASDRDAHGQLFGRASRAEDKLTEAGAADRFARRHGDDFKYDYRRGRWLIWDEHRWRPDVDQAIVRAAVDFSRVWQREALDIPDRDRRDAVMQFALKLERDAQILNLLAQARTRKPIADAGDRWDTDGSLICTPNGVVDLVIGVLQPGHPDDRITMQTNTPYDPDAACPRWTQFIAEVFDKDQELVDFVQRAIGYSLSGFTTEQVLFLLFGTGSNGRAR